MCEKGFWGQKAKQNKTKTEVNLVEMDSPFTLSLAFKQ